MIEFYHSNESYGQHPLHEASQCSHCNQCSTVQVWIQLVTLICILLKMALLGLFNKHFMQCGLIKPIQVKHEHNYCGIIFFITCRYEQTKSDCN